MKGWFTHAELAGLCLPGLPATKRGVALLCEREAWASRQSSRGEPLARQRSGKGGGLEYHLSLLPPEARAALSARATKVNSLAPAVPKPAIISGPAPDTPERVLRRDARLAVLTMADQHFARNRALGRHGADTDFAARYSAGDVPADPWVKEALASVSAKSILRWRKARDAGQLHAVGGEGRKARPVLEAAEDGDVATYIAALLLHNQFLSAIQLRNLVEERFGRKLSHGLGEVDLPHERSFQRFITEFKTKNRTVLLAATNPDKFKSHIRLAGSDAYAGVTRLNELWEIDASPADVLLTDGRYSVYVIIDVFSRRMLTHVSRTARTEASLALLRKAILAWGVPEILRTDNGSDFTSHAFKRAVNALAIEHDVTAPFSPEQKGIVERSIKTLQHSWISLQPGFIGHDVADRKQIENRKAFAARLGETDDRAFCVELTHDVFQHDLDRYCSEIYAHRQHAGLGTTPFLKAQSAIGAIRTITNIRALDLLLSPIPGGGWRVATKTGIRIDGGNYISGALQPGQRVFCRQDTEDMGRLYVFEDEHGAFLCEAICPERAGADPRQAVAMARAEQKRIVKEGLADAKALARTIKPRHMVDAMLRLAERNTPNVTAFPRRTEEHGSEALTHAAQAVEEGVPTNFEPPFEAPSKPVEPPVAGNVVKLPETSKQRFQRAQALQDLKARGLTIGDDEARWLGSYETTAEYKSMAAFFADFGSEWLNA